MLICCVFPMFDPDLETLLQSYTSRFGSLPAPLLFRSPKMTRRIFEIIELALEQNRPLTKAEVFALRRKGSADCASTIETGDTLPDAVFLTMKSSGPQYVSVEDVFTDKCVVLFAITGAFNPTSHYFHLPGFLDRYDALKARGVDTVACTAVNDVFVLDEWAILSGARDKIIFLADGNGDFAASIGMKLNARPLGLGNRSVRYSMLVRNRRVDILNVEEDSCVSEISSAGAMIEAMSALVH